MEPTGLDGHLNSPEDLMLGGESVTVHKLTIEELLRISHTVDRVKGSIGMTREDFKGFKLNGEAVTELLMKLREVVASSSDYTILNEGEDNERVSIRLTGAGRIIALEISRLLKVTPDAMLRSTPDELAEIGMAFWEVNGNGPFGKRVRTTTAALIPFLRNLKDMAFLELRREVIKARLAGGMDDGGMIESSSPSTSDSTGPKNTSSEESQPSESSQ